MSMRLDIFLDSGLTFEYPTRLRNSPLLRFVAVLGLLCFLPAAGFAATVTVPPDLGGPGIQQALDKAGAGGEVVLERGTYLVKHSVNLSQDRQSLRGAGPETILRLADNANCPVVILGAPLGTNHGVRYDLHLSNLLVDGNRAHQQQEVSLAAPLGPWLYNNDILVWNADDAVIEQVTCCRARSGGLVSTEQVHRLTVRDYESYSNQFDGLACYQTYDSHFSRMNLHNNPGAGISLDLDFASNVIDSSMLMSNDLGIFMRQSHDNLFSGVTICCSGHDGVFMAQAGGWTAMGWKLFPGTECTGNRFTNLRVQQCGGTAVRVNNDSCTNNILIGAVFLDNAKGGLIQPAGHPVMANLAKKGAF
jgi:hypothetical protein